LYSFPEVRGAVVTTPTNMAAVTGTDVIFKCSSDSALQIRWDYYAPGSNQPRTVFNGDKMSQQFVSRYRVTSKQGEGPASSKQRQGPVSSEVPIEAPSEVSSELLIVGVRLGDAGHFVCFESSKTLKFAATLVVLGRLCWSVCSADSRPTYIFLARRVSHTIQRRGILHWLPISSRFKIAAITDNTLVVNAHFTCPIC
jgi:hypothetical protein